ncbi:MAG: hypothetical protein KDL87_09730, partial [Verrucomicrobiae bacterium]|nr:hypothetical protein [Verrucomicrobiae bacterium]
MKSFSKTMLAIAGFAALGASAAMAAPWPPVNGDLLLGFQAAGGTGGTTNVFVNLGPAYEFRDNAAQGVVANINSELTAAFGASWYTRTDVFFGVIANRSNSSSAPDENGDPTRTLYVSRTTTTPGAAALRTGFTSSALGVAGTKLQGQVGAVDDIVANGNQVMTMTQSGNPTQWNNSWTTWNPLLSGGASQGAAYTVIGGGIQNHLGVGGAYTYVDVQRITTATGSGTFIGSVGIGSNGDVFLTSGEVTINPSVTTKKNKDGGTVSGGGTFVAGEETGFDATPDPGNTFVRWVVKRANGDKEYYYGTHLDIAL